MKDLLVSALFIFICFQLTAQTPEKPKIGLALSGGGAKGLSHIGILQAIDSAGLKIDAITGTSMGAVVGSLYAIGYSGNEIEKIARNLDWNQLFMSTPGLRDVGYIHKEEFGKYPLQFPIEKGKIKRFTGILEAQGIWQKFAELYFPAYQTTDFSQFDIPFLCIATDLSTGEPVELREGDITKAVRASMAIPSVFTTVDYKNTKLIDGGVVLNFPVKNLEEFGIDYTIGVNLSQGLLEAEKLHGAIDVLLQIAFYKDADNFNEQKELCNLLIEPPINDFSAASFNSSDSIINIGIETGRQFYPYFKKLADSLQHKGTHLPAIGNRLPKVTKVVLDKIEVNGIGGGEKDKLLAQLDLDVNKSYSAKELNSAVNKAYSTMAYRKISYALSPRATGHAVISFDVKRNPQTFLNLGLHYTPYSGNAIIANYNTQNQIHNNSRTSVSLNISENLRAKASHQIFFTDRQRAGMDLRAEYEFFKTPIYVDFVERYLYKNHYARFNLEVFKLLGHSAAMGLGIKRDWLALKPDISPIEFYKARNSFLTAYAFLKQNTLDERSFPHSGIKLDVRGGMVFNQNPDASFVELSQEIQLGDSIRGVMGAYPQLIVKLAQYVPLRPRTTLFYHLNSGINFNPERSFMNFYSVGGLQDFLRNQIPFAGLQMNELNTNSIIGFQLGVQIEPFRKFFTILRANMGLYDFVGLKPDEWNSNNLLNGYALSIGYRSALGPIELSGLYNQQNNSLASQISIGFAF